MKAIEVAKQELEFLKARPRLNVAYLKSTDPRGHLAMMYYSPCIAGTNAGVVLQYFDSTLLQILLLDEGEGWDWEVYRRAENPEKETQP